MTHLVEDAGDVLHLDAERVCREAVGVLRAIGGVQDGVLEVLSGHVPHALPVIVINEVDVGRALRQVAGLRG